jgi:hypothetical protein
MVRRLPELPAVSTAFTDGRVSEDSVEPWSLARPPSVTRTWPSWLS